MNPDNNPAPKPPAKAADDPAGLVSAEAGKLRESALLEMAKALRALSIYPPRHPQRDRLMELAFNALQGTLSRIGDLSCQVARSGFLMQQLKLGHENAMIRELAQEMHLRQLKSFSLRRELTLSDFTRFLELLLEDPDKFRQGGFIENWCKSHRVMTVWINEIDFSRLVSSSGPEENLIDQPTPPPLEDLFEELLVRLTREADPEKFGQLLREAEAFVRPLIENKQNKLPRRLVLSLSGLLEDERRQGAAAESVRALAQRTIQGLVKGPFLKSLLERRALPELPDAPELDRLFYQVGSAVINPALEIAASREALQAYRPLLDLILGFGPEAVKLLEPRLADDNPVLARKAVYLLGELRDRSAVEPLKTMLSHEDPRLRREAVRALIRIRGLESSRALIGALGSEKDQETRMLMVQGLAEARDLAATPVLIKLLKKTRLGEDGGAEAEIIIEALSRIGSREALPPLIKLLNRRALLNRELKLKLRIKAAQALGQLGGESAMQALARYARGKQTPLSRACTEALARLLEKEGANNGEADG